MQWNGFSFQPSILDINHCHDMRPIFQCWYHGFCILCFNKCNTYRTRVIIIHSWFEATLDYKPRILGPTILVYVLKWSVILTSLAMKNGVKNIQTAGYNGGHTVFIKGARNSWTVQPAHNSDVTLTWLSKRVVSNENYWEKLVAYN